MMEYGEVVVRGSPQATYQPKTNSLRLSEAALDSFDAAAAKLEGRHPELAAALADWYANTAAKIMPNEIMVNKC